MASQTGRDPMSIRRTSVTFDLAAHIDDLAVAFDNKPREWDEEDELEEEEEEEDDIEDLVSDLWQLSF
tara:strand:+ start:344 stop:547 length:204 start_codon:yes stop_codon:yes gene_type:complete